MLTIISAFLKELNPKIFIWIAGVIFIGYLLHQWKYSDLKDCKADVTRWTKSYSDLNKEIKSVKRELNTIIVERDNALTEVKKLKDDINIYRMDLETCKAEEGVYSTATPAIIKPRETVKDGYIVF